MRKPLSPFGTAPSVSRRRFLVRSSLAMGAAFSAPYLLRGADLNSKINIAVVGAGGKGSSDTDLVASENIVALCDVDKNTLNERGRKYSKAKLYQDYRKMFDEMEKSIDAVIVATPDHVHAPAGTTAMHLKKHLYCQKPLTQTVYEARVMKELAKKNNLITQMGNQGSAANGLRRTVEVVHAGTIGAVKEIHVWSNRPIWPQGIERPAGEDPVPETLDWNLWLGPAPLRPYKKGVYHTFAWRGWYDFGTGALGDMACHTVNMPFRACKLGYPEVVECEETSQKFSETYPKTSRIRFEFPKREGLPATKFFWYDGSPGDKSVKLMRPSPEIVKTITEQRGDLPGSGALLIGEKGQIFSPDDYGSQFFLMMNGEKSFIEGKKHDAAKGIPEKFPRYANDNDYDTFNHQEWLKAMHEGKAEICFSRFEIAAYLTEIILLGCIAMRVGKRLDWDGPGMKAKNAPEAAQYVKRNARPGWEVKA